MSSSCENCAKKATCTSKDAKPGETPEQYQERLLIEQRLCGIKNKVLVMSGKGGVGKSSTAVNLALALAEEGKTVGLLDVDIHGPSIPTMLGAENMRPMGTDNSMLPIVHHGIKVMSIGFLLPKQTDPVIWRGPMKSRMILQFIRDVEWGELDYLVVDCPPGTGDEPLVLLQLLGDNTRAVIVTTPQEVALSDVRKSVMFCRQMKLPILGVIENMSGFVCPHCGKTVDIFSSGGGERMASEMEIHFLGKIPIDPEIVASGDAGLPYVVSHKDSPTTEAVRKVARELIGQADKIAVG
ncbi:MAG: Mrp/NBP35 family ATP-binding protein [Deltaproteobacteria bacterium]|nr:Mrp/NBP35 family ATP-binding protein [Deltaproteobacteria bacterium]MBR5704543.1 Mrp/NBP35 family ATP-binding protein [Deltaproteobacteria bacterium]